MAAGAQYELNHRDGDRGLDPRAARDHDHVHDPDDRSLGHIRPIERNRRVDYRRGIRGSAYASSSRVRAERVSTPAAAARVAARSASVVHTRPVEAGRLPAELARKCPVQLAPKE